MKIKLSNTSKMPCKSWGIPAIKCKTGAKLAKIKGSVCNNCYALRGAYKWNNVKNAYQERLNQFYSNNGNWIDAMIKEVDKEAKRQLKTTEQAYFRFFDSGDLQSINMLHAIVSVANNLPHVKFWLPTREIEILKEYFNLGYKKPANLTIRLSDMMIDIDVTLKEELKKIGILQSGVTEDENKANCASFKQHGKCEDCRACWDSKDKIYYLKH